MVLKFEMKREGFNHQIQWLFGRQLKRCCYGNVAFETSCAFILWPDTHDNSQAPHGIAGDADNTHVNVDVCIAACFQQDSAHLNPCKFWYLEKNLLRDAPRSTINELQNMFLHNFTEN